MPATFSGIFHVVSSSGSANYVCHIKNDLDEVSEVTITYYYPSGNASPFPLAFQQLHIGEVYHISGDFRIEENCVKMTASQILPQSIYNNIPSQRIADKFTSTMLSITGHVQIMRPLASSTSAYFEDFPDWKYILCESTQYNSAIKANTTFQMRLYINTAQKNFTPQRLATLTPGKKIFFIGACNIEFEETDFPFGVIFSLTLDIPVKGPEMTTPRTTPSKRQRVASPTLSSPTMSFGTRKDRMATPPPKKTSSDHHSEDDEQKSHRSETPTPHEQSNTTTLAADLAIVKEKFTRKRNTPK